MSSYNLRLREEFELMFGLLLFVILFTSNKLSPLFRDILILYYLDEKVFYHEFKGS